MCAELPLCSFDCVCRALNRAHSHLLKSKLGTGTALVVMVWNGSHLSDMLRSKGNKTRSISYL